MRRMIIILVALFIGVNLSAQDQSEIGVDGMYLGKYWQGIYAKISREHPSYKIKHDKEKRCLSATEVHGLGTNSYSIYYGTDDKVVKISKASYVYNELYINDIYVEMNYALGQPAIQGNSSCIWRTDKYKVSITVSGQILPHGSPCYHVFETYEKFK